jgi:hypothetical protein
MIDKKSYFSKFKLAILFSVGLGVGFYIANIENERSQFVQIVPSEYKSFEFQKADYDAFKVYDIDNLLSDEIDDRDAHLISGQKYPLRAISAISNQKLMSRLRRYLKLHWRAKISSMSILKTTHSKIYGLSLLTLFRK